MTHLPDTVTKPTTSNHTLIWYGLGLIALLPLVALATVNLYHAVQYFALVWMKEGGRMTDAFGRGNRKLAIAFFFAGSAVFGLGYMAAVSDSLKWVVAPFIACSLLHFWYDGFVWSVRKRQL